jgi:TolB protein
VLEPATGLAAVAVGTLCVVGAVQGDGGNPRTLGAAVPGRLAFPFAPGAWSKIYVSDGRDLFVVTNEDATDLRPTWAPGGRRLAFQSDRGGSKDMFVLDAPLAKPHLLTNDPADDGEPAWSPDARRIAFVSNRRGSDDIYTVRVDGTGLTRVTTDGADERWPTWSPDGRRIAYTAGGDLYISRATGGGRRLVAHDVASPAWAPGKRVVFARRYGEGWAIYVLYSARAVRLTVGPDDFAPAWSADGRTLVFLSDRDGVDQLFALDIATRRVGRLTSREGEKESPALAPTSLSRRAGRGRGTR